MSEWEDLKGYEGLYKINRKGEIYSCKKKYILWCHENIVALRKEGIEKKMPVHVLVAKQFIKNPNGYKYVIHKNKDKLDNRVENLEWSDISPNCRPVKNIETGEVYRSINEAAAALGINHANISRACYDRSKKAGGYHWRH